MKILLVTRGSNGDIFPYFTLTKELIRQGHSVTLSIPRLFEDAAKESGVPCFLQDSDDIAGMVEGVPSFEKLLEWTRRVIDAQFDELIPMLKEHDILVAANTEFAAPSIAEYCKKPIIRTAYAPLIPGNRIKPPVITVLPWCVPVSLQWGLVNVGADFMSKKNINKQRLRLGMEPIKSQADYAPRVSYNFLMHSRYLGETDPSWKYRWDIGGYCFNDELPYDKTLYDNFISFVKKDSRPTLFFTLGSCNATQRDSFCEWLFEICSKAEYKMVVGCGWWKVGTSIHQQKDLFLLDKAVPHNIIFPYCDAVIHHGGSGTTHSVARAGKPQLIAPLIIDQFYWAYRAQKLGLGPKKINIAKTSKKALAKSVIDLMTNESYKKNAIELSKKMQSENGLEAAARYIVQCAT
jgi:UDP:flavonoid glycosyltransferase YjiC (YdhE family)